MTTKQYIVYHLHFTSALHAGSVRDDYGSSNATITSDSLYAALTATIAKIGIEVPKDGDLGCVISSLFPYRQLYDNITYYFPKPQCTRYEQLIASQYKTAKKAQWLSKESLERVLNGEDITLEETPAFYESHVLKHMRVPRAGCDDNKAYFYMDRIFYKTDSGLYFLAEGNTTLIDKAMPLLAQEGIGTDRNVGNGSFEYTKDTLSINIPGDNQYGYSLSTFIPESREQLAVLLDDNCSYDLKRCGGWISTSPYNTIRKNAIYAFKAGAVFHQLQSGQGEIVDLAPMNIVGHPVWRCGKALVLPIKIM